MKVEKSITYRAEVADISKDGKQVRIVTDYDGPFNRGRSPRHVETLDEDQARDLVDSLQEALDKL